MEPLTGFNSKGRLLSIPASIRLGKNRLSMINTLAYYNTELSKVIVELHIKLLSP